MFLTDQTEENIADKISITKNKRVNVMLLSKCHHICEIYVLLFIMYINNTSFVAAKKKKKNYPQTLCKHKKYYK